MTRFPIYTYKDIKEFNLLFEKLSEKKDSIYSFKFGETESLLENHNELTIDITNLINYLIQFPQDIYLASINFENLDETSRVIIKENLADHALEIFRLIFDHSVPLYPDEADENNEDDLLDKILPLKRQCLYTYSVHEIDQVIACLDKKSIPLVNFSRLNNQLNEVLNKYAENESGEIIIDLSSTVLAMENNANLIYLIEQYLSIIEDYNVIINEDIADKALDYLRLTFSHAKEIENLIPEITSNTKQNEIVKDGEIDNLTKITDLKVESLEKLLNQISFQLFGHKRFKDRFSDAIKEFIFLNKIKEKKVFSVFLLGPSGVGKTEFARIVKNNLKESTTLAKINFGNYSSQDSLNSLIGSPRGYIGSEEGELSIKLQKSQAGILLCDEFEKASKSIYNFFLELLEEGVYTDSQSREYVLDGYLVIFTSNLDEQNFYKTIPEELQSRIDLVCVFDKLSIKEKQEYINYLTNSFLEKLQIYTGKVFTDEYISEVKNVNVDSVDNMRDIKRIVIGNLRERMSTDS